MKLSQIKYIVDKIDECDEVLIRWNASDLSEGMRDCIKCAVIERKHNLIDKLKAVGIEVEA